MEDLAEEYQNLPDMDTCKISIQYKHNKQVKKDGTVKEQIQKRAYVRTKPFTKHRRFISTLVQKLSEEDSDALFNSVDWHKYIHKKAMNKIITDMTNEEFEEFYKSIDWEKFLPK